MCDKYALSSACGDAQGMSKVDRQGEVTFNKGLGKTDSGVSEVVRGERKKGR